MNEKTWVSSVRALLNKHLSRHDSRLHVEQGLGLAYVNEIISYKGTEPIETKIQAYETDLIVIENLPSGGWKPRIVIECKLATVTTHDAITYSEKAFTHKKVHPYLRYGIMLGKRKHYPLPGRLFRHGAYFDFMLSWVSSAPLKSELKNMIDIILDEVDSSRALEELLYNSRRSGRKRYSVLQRPLRLK